MVDWSKDNKAKEGFDKFGNRQPEGQEPKKTFVLTEEDFEQTGPSLYRLLPKGEYEFTVKDWKFKIADTGTEFVEVTLGVEDDDGEARVSDKLFLTRKSAWRLGTFFKAIGMKEEMKNCDLYNGDNWDKILEKTGRFVNGHRAGSNDKQYNEVKSYVIPLKQAVG